MSDLRHEQLAADVRHFRDPTTGEPMFVAAKYHRRALADLMYLGLARTIGQVEAGRRTCEKHGHEPAGRGCGRCGAYLE